jgi:site-specific recombinase XerD
MGCNPDWSVTMNQTEKLDQAITDYLLWMMDQGYSRSTWSFYERILIRYRSYVGDMDWETAFSKNTMADFGQECGLVQFEPPIRGLARYLYKNKKITRSMDTTEVLLPAIYQQYLEYYQKTSQVCALQVLNTRRVLVLFSQWMIKEKIKLQKLEIEHADRFQAEVSNRYGTKNREHHRSVLRGFFRWLHGRKITRRNLAPLLVAPPQYALAVPPKFLRPGELQKLFARRPDTATEKRTWTMLHLACFLGLRPKEISLIRLDDIDFSRQEIILPMRKAANPICMALPMSVIKTIAEYIIEIRPETAKRELFLRLRPPFSSVSGQLVGRCISQWMRQCGVKATAYHLRHTYALNLLKSGASVFAIKEMLGHDGIQATSRYLSIETDMMREVLFHETL